jgi:hypothetical protein
VNYFKLIVKCIRADCFNLELDVKLSEPKAKTLLNLKNFNRLLNWKITINKQPCKI